MQSHTQESQGKRSSHANGGNALLSRPTRPFLVRTPAPIQSAAETNTGPIQRLMNSTAFKASLSDGGASGHYDHISTLLDTFHNQWGVPLVGKHSQAHHRQKRLQHLNDLQKHIHHHFRDSGQTRIADAGEANPMLNLLDDVQKEHENQIGVMAGYGELPIDQRGVSEDDKARVQQHWNSIVEGTGNLKITEQQINKANPNLRRNHAGFKTKALSSIARLMQHPQGRKLVEEANAGGGDPTKHITISPVSNQDHQVPHVGTLPADGWDAEPLDQSKDSTKHAKSHTPGSYTHLPNDTDSSWTYEYAQSHQGDKTAQNYGVKSGGNYYQFNEGTGSKIQYGVEHRDSENRVYTQDDREGLSPTYIALGHEMGHALHNRRGASLSGAGPGDHIMAAHGVTQDETPLWSGSPEEFQNINQVENKLLHEGGLKKRKYHKDYEETKLGQVTTRWLHYRDAPHTDLEQAAKNARLDTIRQAVMDKDHATAHQLLTEVGH